MKILYITGNFRALTHTFITREVQKVRDTGDEVQLLALYDGTSAPQAANPECDLSGCRYIYPIGALTVLLGAVRCLLTRPGRFFRAWRIVSSDSSDSMRNKAKLFYELLVATTLMRWVEADGIEHIHAHLAVSPTTYALLLHVLTGVPFSFTGHAADLYREPIALKPKLEHAAGLVCISEYNRQHYLQMVPGLTLTPIIHCGINLNEFPRRQKSEAGSPLVVFSVGRCVPKKGFDDLLQAMAILARNSRPWTARIAGDGPLLSELKLRATDLGLTDRVEFLGSVPQETVRRELETADLFVLPSVPVSDGDIDGIPVSLMEAMAVGCPVVSTEVSGIPELVRNGESGMLVPPRSPAELADAMRTIDEDPELYRKLADGGRQTIEDEFDLATIGTQLNAFFRDAAARKSDRRSRGGKISGE